MTTDRFVRLVGELIYSVLQVFNTEKRLFTARSRSAEGRPTAARPRSDTLAAPATGPPAVGELKAFAFAALQRPSRHGRRWSFHASPCT